MAKHTPDIKIADIFVRSNMLVDKQSQKVFKIQVVKIRFCELYDSPNIT